MSYLRTEYSGYKFLDSINKNINTTNFNAFLTLFITFAILKAFPPALSWMVLDANISGDTKEACTGTGACWTYIKVWFKRFMYGMYPNELHWRINSAFLLVIGLGFVGYFFKENLKKYLALRIELPLKVLPVSFGALILRSSGEIFFKFFGNK